MVASDQLIIKVYNWCKKIIKKYEKMDFLKINKEPFIGTINNYKNMQV